MPVSLPILDIVPNIKAALSQHNTLILQAPPGAGKSTVLPLELLAESWLGGQKILLLEPRRLAARAVATRMASLLDESIGATVGYRIRFDHRIGANTRLEVLTEGILTRRLQHDPTLEGVGLVIFDEFHERNLHSDLALALCRESQQVLREDLRILIMSATLDGAALSTLLNHAPVLTSKGRQHPIRIQYLGHEPDEALSLQVARAIRRALAEGDVLAFLPGAGEIHRTAELVQTSHPAVVIYPLYGDLPPAQQQAALLPDPEGRQKVVLATTIAETSLTIEGIRAVVDSGYTRVPRFDPRTGFTRLETIRVSQDAADQRAGRAGRLGPGVGYRLWSEGLHQQLAPNRTPEILEADLAPVVLELAQWGADIRSLTWLTPPPVGATSQARELLNLLGALDGVQITERGREMLRLPTHPRVAHLLLEGKAASLTALATDVAALLEERDPLAKEAGADLSLRVEILRKWRGGGFVNADRQALERIERLALAWRKLFGIPVDNTFIVPAQVGMLVAAAYPERMAKQRDAGRETYKLANGRGVRLAERDPLVHEPWLAVAHLDAGAGSVRSPEGRIFLAAPLNPADMVDQFKKEEVIRWDTQRGELVARIENRLGEITVSSMPLTQIPPETQVRVLAEVLRKEGETMLSWTEALEQWQARLMSLQAWRPEDDWPDVSRQNLLATVSDWLSPFLTTVRRKEDFAKLDITTILKDTLPWAQRQELDALAPETLLVPSGSHIKVLYQPDGGSPILAVRLQEMFGLADTPLVNGGRTPVLLHLLSPGYRPVQVTQDLRSFWNNTYPAVRKELRVRYQKHHWPEDPWTAEAVRGAKRRNP
ncbi:MAG: ATP-dependent helicase HrpB [Bacteroidota bacterium]